MKEKKAFLAIVIFLMSFPAWSQVNESNATSSAGSEAAMNLVREIFLNNGTSKSEEIVITIEDDVKRFELMISTSISTGKLIIGIYDSYGKKQGNFSVGTQLSTDKELVHGNITKSLKEPQAGIWKVKIDPTNARGIVKIATTFIQ